MELINKFAELSKTLSEEFHLKKSEVSLYLLVLIQHTFKIAEAQYQSEMLSNSYGSFLIEDGDLDENIFRSIKDSGLINLNSFNEDEIREYSDYLIAEYLKSKDLSLLTSNFYDEIANLATESALELDFLNDGEPLYDKELSIYIANVGTGDIIIKLLRQLESKGIFEENCRVVGEEPDETLTFLTKINCFAHRITASLLINDSNPLENPLTNFGIGLSEDPHIAISLPPFTNTQQQELENFYRFIGSTEKIYFSELAYIKLMLKRVSEKGKVIAVVRNEILSSRKSKIFREKYLKNDWIEKVIALPKNFVNYPIDISVIVFNKTKLEKGFVIFDGSEDKFEKTKISIEDIFSNDVDLRVARYATNGSKELRNILTHSQSPVKKIKDLVESSVSGFNYSPNDRIIETSSKTLPYVRVSDLARNETVFDLNISEVKRKISREKAHARTVIDFSVVLVSKIAPNLKPTYFKFTGQPIVIGSDVIALKMKENIDVEYFLTQLHSQLVQTQVEMMSSGATIKRISTKDFLNIQIFLPTLEEQQRQILEMRGVIEEKAIAQEKVAKAEEQTEAIEYEVIANMNHSLKNKLGVIINDYDTLVRFLQRKERTNSAVSFNDTIRPVFEGENVADVDTIKLITQRLKNNLLDTSKVFNTSLKLQTRELNKTPVELVSYFRNELKSLYAGQNFKIEVVAKPGLKLNILIDKEVFKEAIDNLINNAKSHGFVEKDREYKIVFELSKSGEVYDEDSETVKNYARIIYKNDGKSFPKGFSFNDYVRYSSKAGKTQGTGIGGAIVDRIIKLHEGKFNEIPNGENSLFSVKFEILLPLDD